MVKLDLLNHKNEHSYHMIHYPITMADEEKILLSLLGNDDHVTY